MLVVRVKRNRNDDPAENICIFEENQPRKKRSFAKHLSIIESGDKPALLEQPSGNHLILTRVETVDFSTGSNLDSHTVSLVGAGVKRNRSEIEEDSSVNGNVKLGATGPKVIVTKSKKMLSADSSGKFVVLDMNQIGSDSNFRPKNDINANDSILQPAASVVKTPVKVLDPATRLLERGIKSAIEKGDFNDMSSALMQGANANHQTRPEDGGLTPLMAATSRCNVRMVRRLLLKDVDVLLKDSRQGLAALDMLKETSRNKEDCLEIRLLLHSAVTKAYAALSRRSERNSVAISMLLGNSSESQYVVDIYCVQQPTPNTLENQNQPESADIESTNIEMDTTASTAVQTSSSTSTRNAVDTSGYSVVRVEGLRIRSNEGGGGDVEIVDEEYDSDWSDLADDEEPDSNDERFAGNDYPDEDQGDEDEEANAHGAYGSDGSDAENLPSTRRQAGFGNSNSKVRFANQNPHAKSSSARSNTAFERFRREDGDDEEDDEGEGEEGSGEEDEEEQDNARYEKRKGGGDGGNDGSDYDFSGDEQEEDARVPRFDRSNGIGKVLRPHVVSMSGDGAVAVPSHGVHDSESLRELWDEANPMSDGEDEGPARHAVNRLQHMRARTGMQFGANPREFGSDGLPKYGAELSDDDEDMMSNYVEDRTSGGLAGLIRSKDIVAYDSELDHSD